MDSNTTDEGSEKQNTERPLPRGLDHLSHLFLSHPPPERVMQERSRISTAEQPYAVPGDQPVTVALRPGRNPPREHLLSLLRQQTSALEEGLKAIDANIPCEVSGNIELLALDRSNQLAIIDLDDKPNDYLLLRGIAHFDSLVRNMPYVRRLDPGQVINLALQPLLFLVAPEFSDLFRIVMRQITSMEIQCVKYHAIAMSGGTGIFFEHAFNSGSRERR